MRGIYHQASQLQELAVTTDHRGGSAVQGPTPQSRIYFSGALVPTESTPWVCHLWRWLSVVWSCLLGALAERPPERYRSRSITACVLPRATWHKLQNYLQMAATCARLRDAQVRPGYKPRQAAASARAGVIKQEVQDPLRPDAACLRDFRKIWSRGQDRPFLWKNHWKPHGWVQKFCGVGSYGITRAGQAVWARGMESQTWSLPAGSVRGEFI